MSRIGKQPVAVPANVKVKIADGKVFVEGPKGKLELVPHRNMKVELAGDNKSILVKRPNDERQNRALHGLTRSLIANMVEGVVKGYEKRLKIEGIGYQAAAKQKGVGLTVGYANRILMLNTLDNIRKRQHSGCTQRGGSLCDAIAARRRLVTSLLRGT